MKYWWKLSLAIVFSELTCINGDCSILGQWGGREGEANDYVFRELIVKLFSNNNFNVLLSGTQCQGQSKKKKKSYRELKKKKKG